MADSNSLRVSGARRTTHAWLAGDTPLHPRDGLTEPAIDKPGGYT
jgi:hypothetical protein